jgi:Transposase IS116/IS110/IS902 family/Transposase
VPIRILVVQELGFELWTGDPAEVQSKRVRKQKTDRQDAQLLLRLMMEDRFPRIWIPDASNRDMRQLLWHRHRLVQMRTRVMNQLHVVALNEGLAIVLAPWATLRPQDLLDLLDQLTPKIQELTHALEEEVEKRAVTRRLMTHPGVGPLTALAYELVIGTPERFHCGKQIASYVGLVPAENAVFVGWGIFIQGATHPSHVASAKAGGWPWRFLQGWGPMPSTMPLSTPAHAQLSSNYPILHRIANSPQCPNHPTQFVILELGDV